MPRLSTHLLLALAALGCTLPLHAGQQVDAKSCPIADKCDYTLFNPTPANLLREFSPDRPDTTEGPFTVDAGHVQVETSFFDYSRERGGGTRTDTWTFLSTNIRVGVLCNVEFDIIFNAYTRSREHTAGVSSHTYGFSDLTFRSKINLWGNDGGATAFALLPYLKIPTGTQQSNDNVEGGLILPFSWSINDRLGLGTMVQAGVVYDAGVRRHHVEWLHTLCLAYGVTDALGVYVEYVGIASGQAEFDYQAYFNTGTTFALTDNLALDAGVRLGLTQAGEDCGVFSGMSVRF